MSFVSDTFAGSAGTNLSAHTSDDGAVWGKTISGAGYTGDAVLDGTGGVYGSSPLALYGASGSGHIPAGADYDVAATFDQQTAIANVQGGICVHAVGSPQAAVILIYDENNGYFELVIDNAGSFQVATSRVIILGNGTQHDVILSYRTGLGGHATYTVNVDGADEITFDDASPPTTAGLAGVYFNHSGTASTVSTGLHIRAFSASDPGGGSASFTVAGPNSATSLPSNHNGNITLTLVGSGTSWTGSSTFTPSGVSGWAFVSKSVTDGTHATVVLSCPSVASPPAGATGTLTLTEGVTGTGTATISVASPTLAVSPNSGNTGTTPSTTFTGTHTLWQGDNPQFTLSGGTGASIGSATATTNTASSATVTYGSAAGTLTLTDPSTGAQATITVAPPPTVAHPGDAYWTFSPYNWQIGSGAASTNQAGAYFKVAFTGTSWSLAYTNNSASENCTVRYSVDGAEATDVQLAVGASTLGATGLSSGTHSLLLWMLTIGSNDRWGHSGTPPTDLLTLDSLTLDSGASLAALSTVSGLGGGDLDVQAKTLLIYGDSITNNVNGPVLGTFPGPAYVDATQDWATSVAYALRAEYGIVAMPGLGWQTVQLDSAHWPYFYTPGNDGSGPGGSSWNKYYYGQSRLVSGALAPAPDYVLVNMGTNDAGSDAGVQASVAGWLAACRAAVGSTTPIILLVPFNGARQSPIAAAVTAVGDAHVYLIDVSAYTHYQLTNDDATTHLKSQDGLHPKVWWHARMGALIALEAQAALTPGGGGGGRRRVW